MTGGAEQSKTSLAEPIDLGKMAEPKERLGLCIPIQVKASQRSRHEINWEEMRRCRNGSYPCRLLLSRAVSKLSLIARCMPTDSTVITRRGMSSVLSLLLEIWNVLSDTCNDPASAIYGDSYPVDGSASFSYVCYRQCCLLSCLLLCLLQHHGLVGQIHFQWMY